LIVLDENILDGQRLLLEASRMATRQIGVDLGRKGTRDADFYLPELRHPRYCLVAMNVGQNEVAAFVRRFLRHLDFDTQVKRMGNVIPISHAGLAIWRLRPQTEIHAVWSRSK
jgi:hypothetical protein